MNTIERLRDLVERGVASTEKSELVDIEKAGLAKLWPGPYGTYFYQLTDLGRAELAKAST